MSRTARNLTDLSIIEDAMYDFEKLKKAVEYDNLVVAEPLAKAVINRIILFFGKNGTKL